ncbi:MAG: T9SS type A sorting domain-containing protein [Candidatus Kapaibacterium sp.]
MIRKSAVSFFLLALVWFFISEQSSAQSGYDVTTQAIRTVSPLSIAPEYMCTSNLGNFVSGGGASDVYLLGCSGTSVANTNSIESDANIATATNHDNVFALLTVGNVGSTSNLWCRIWNDKSNAMLSGSVYNGLTMTTTGVLGAGVPDKISVGTTTAGGSGLITCVEANMDSKYLYIAYQTSSNRLGYAILKLSDLSIAVPANDIILAGGVHAVGSIPTVACYRWAQTSRHIAFSELAVGGWMLHDFQISSTLATTDVALPRPSLTSHVNWVRAVCADDVSGASFTGYYYGGFVPTNPCGKLYYCDGANVNTITTSFHYSGDVPNMAVGDPYHAWAFGAHLGSSVFFAYAESDCGIPETLTLKVCRQYGTDQRTIYTAAATGPSTITYYYLGSNQMGTFCLYDQMGTPKWWRNFQSFDEDLQENTLAAGLCHVTGVGPDPINLFVHQGDTLRIYKKASLSTEQFVFMKSLLTIHAGFRYSDAGFTPSAKRAHIMFDRNAFVYFNNLVGCNINAEARGSWEYDGATFSLMDFDVLGATGNKNTPDTSEANKGLIFMNAPLTIDQGSGILCSKGQITWPGISVDPYPNFLKIEGASSFLDLDSCTVFLGSRNTAHSEPNIYLNSIGEADAATYLSVKHSVVATQYQNNIIQDLFDGDRDDGHTPPDGFRSDIIVNWPDHVVWDHNRVLFAYLEVAVAANASSVTYTNNDVCIAQNGGLFYATETPSETFHLHLDNNSIHETWPIGNNSGSPVNVKAVDFEIQKFDQLNLDQVTVDNNVFDGAFPYIPSIYKAPATGGWTGVYASQGTNCTITNNSLFFRYPGIHTEAASLSRPFLCNNTMEWCSCDHSGTGILQDGSGSALGGYTKLNFITNQNNGYIASGHDLSNLLSNFIEHYGVGVKFEDYAKTTLSGDHVGASNCPGWNRIRNSDHNEIEVAGSAQPNIGSSSGDHPNWGRNIIHSTGDGVELFYRTGATILTTPLTDNNWDPTITTGTGITTDPQIAHTQYDKDANESDAEVTYSCGGFSTRKGSQERLANGVSTLDTPDSLKLYQAALKDFVPGDSILLRRGLDTMELYIQLHPFATKYPGKVIDAILSLESYMTNKAGDHDHYNWKRLYNWMVDAYQWNMDTHYQQVLWDRMSDVLSEWDLNESANMWYNETLQWPDDKLYDSVAYEGIAQERRRQHTLHQDTLPFHVLSLPLKKVPVPLEAVTHIAPTIRVTDLSLSPNPASAATKIDYYLEHGGASSITIYDELGREVERLSDLARSAGSHEIVFTPSKLQPGVYFVRLSTETGEVVTRSLVIKR